MKNIVFVLVFKTPNKKCPWNVLLIDFASLQMFMEWRQNVPKWAGKLWNFEFWLAGRTCFCQACRQIIPGDGNFFTKLNFTKFVNRNAKILRRRLYSPSLMDVAWLEDAQLIVLIFHTYQCVQIWPLGGKRGTISTVSAVIDIFRFSFS